MAEDAKRSLLEAAQRLQKSGQAARDQSLEVSAQWDADRAQERPESTPE